jgi:hypothetical protein
MPGSSHSYIDFSIRYYGAVSPRNRQETVLDRLVFVLGFLGRERGMREGSVSGMNQKTGI